MITPGFQDAVDQEVAVGDKVAFSTALKTMPPLLIGRVVKADEWGAEVEVTIQVRLGTGEKRNLVLLEKAKPTLKIQRP